VSYQYQNLKNIIMKTLKSLIMSFALLVICVAANANNKPNQALTRDHAINVYVDAMTHGKLDGLNTVLDESVEFSMLRGNTVLSFSRKEMLDYFQSNKNIEEPCTTTTSIVENHANVEVVEVDMKFNGFVRTNMVTISDTGDGWKITKVYSTFS
jgi:hypothetical protein